MNTKISCQRLHDKAIDFTCDTSKGYEVRALHVYDPHKADYVTKNEIFDLVYPVACSAFCRVDSEEMRQDVMSHVFSSRHLAIVFNDENHCIAFRMWDFIPLNPAVDILYLAGIGIRQDFQGQGIGTSLLQYVLDTESYTEKIRSLQMQRSQCNYAALRTQNPIVKAYFDRAIGGESFPQREGSIIPEDIVKVAKTVAQYISDDHFNGGSLISRGAYGHTIYGEGYRLESKIHDNSALRTLDVQAGDALYCIYALSV